LLLAFHKIHGRSLGLALWRDSPLGARGFGHSRRQTARIFYARHGFGGSLPPTMPPNHRVSTVRVRTCVRPSSHLAREKRGIAPRCKASERAADRSCGACHPDERLPGPIRHRTCSACRAQGSGAQPAARNPHAEGRLQADAVPAYPRPRHRGQAIARTW
jgi:hypothetical protein